MALPFPLSAPMTVSERMPPKPTSRLQWIAAAGLLAAVGWVFLPTLLTLEKLWRTDPDQTHGYLVPLFVAYLIWSGRKQQTDEGEPGSSLWGVLVLGLGLALRFAGIYVYLDWLQAAALVPCLLGIGMIVWGPWRALGALGSAAVSALHGTAAVPAGDRARLSFTAHLSG